MYVDDDDGSCSVSSSSAADVSSLNSTTLSCSGESGGGVGVGVGVDGGDGDGGNNFGGGGGNDCAGASDGAIAAVSLFVLSMYVDPVSPVFACANLEMNDSFGISGKSSDLDGIPSNSSVYDDVEEYVCVFLVLVDLAIGLSTKTESGTFSLVGLLIDFCGAVSCGLTASSACD